MTCPRALPFAALLLAAFFAQASGVPLPAGQNTVWDRIMAEQSAVNLRRGYALMGEENYAAAADEFFRAAQRNPADPLARLLYGSALYWLGAPEKALEEFEEALRLDPRSSMALQLRGIVKARAGEYGAALADFLASEKIDPSRPDVKMNAGSVYQALGNHGRALDYFRAAAALDPSNPLYRYQLGMFYSRLGRYDQAAAQLEKAAALFPGYEDAVLELAILRERDNRLSEAIRLYRKALALKPGDSVARFRLAWALYKAGRVPEVKKALDGAFLLAPVNDKGGISMGLAYAGPPPGGGAAAPPSPLFSALKKIPAGQDARITVELLETPKAALVPAPSGEKLGSRLQSAFRKPKVSYTKREYFLPAGGAEERERRAAGIAAEAEKLMKAVSSSNDARLNFSVETGPPASQAGSKAKALFKPRDVGNDMGLWVMGDNWLENAAEALEEMEPETSAGRELGLIRGLGYLLLGEHGAALNEFSGPGALAALGRGAAWVEAGDEAKALAEYLETLRLDPGNKTALANKAWLGGTK
ncbi:MAG: tetratricopeptide repeat protein [Elusimicrobiales bacterium]|nr:tetratricopeptide repeat protein [Elusimicrobiales bacterium]